MASGGEEQPDPARTSHIRRSAARQVRRASSVACDRDLIRHRGSFSDPENARLSQSEPITDEVQLEGEELFESFLSEEIQKEGLQPPEGAQLDQATREIQSRHEWAQAGADLRNMADAFAQTQERRIVKAKADAIDISDLESSQFHNLLSQLFLAGGITRERIVVLFFFCSDLAIRLLRQHSVDLFQKLISWTIEFIRDHVCNWVAENGGWGAVLSSGFQLLQAIVASFAVILASYSFYRWLKSRF